MEEITELTGRSGQKYIFHITFDSSVFKARPGVYVMAKALGGNRFEFCHVGHTADMSVRPFAPEKVACWRRFGVDRIFHLEEANADKRAAMVQDLIQAYAPTCNAP